MSTNRLHELVRHRDLAGIEELFAGMSGPVELRANEQDEHGATPLVDALVDESPSIEIVQCLLRNGADPNFAWSSRIATSASAGSILELALKHSDVELLKLLCAHGADFAFRDEHGYTAAIHAGYSGWTSTR